MIFSIGYDLELHNDLLLLMSFFNQVKMLTFYKSQPIKLTFVGEP